MVSQAIVLALSTLGFDGWGTSASPQCSTAAPGAFAACSGDPCAAGSCGSGAGCLGCGDGCGTSGLGGCWGKVARCLHCMNGMPQHFPYVNPAWGYYFFRPYNYTVLVEQQVEIAAMRGNPIHPYDNRFFERIYQEVEALPAASAVPEPYATPPTSLPPVLPIAPSDPLPPPPVTH